MYDYDRWNLMIIFMTCDELVSDKNATMFWVNGMTILPILKIKLWEQNEVSTVTNLKVENES